MEKREIKSVFVDGEPLSKESVRFINDYLVGIYSDVNDIRNSLLHVSSVVMRSLPADSETYDVSSVNRFGRACESITNFADELERSLDEENTLRRIKECTH